MNVARSATYPLAAVLAVVLAAAEPLMARTPVRLVASGEGSVPDPDALAVRVDVAGRTSTLRQLDIAAVGQTIPRTFSRHLIGNTPGFDWYVSRHFALKTDLPLKPTLETLTLLELALPQLEAILGQSIAALADRRLAFVFASDRQTLRRAMASDDLHILRLGGITQEGYWGAFQYAGAPYQSRYIVLHEFVHLYQYALVGNTRHCYGFFVEGIADFFSSHVYDADAFQLTINVLDRAPMHNHLAAGLDAWQTRGRPTLSELYHNGTDSRGLDVLMAAFLQSTPEWELKWRIYCDQTMRKAEPDADPKSLSDRLIASLYGDWPALNAAFAAWMERRQVTYIHETYGFDQSGDRLIDDNPLAGQTASLRLHPAPLDQPPFDPLVRDFPHGPLTPRQSSSNAFEIGFTVPVATPNDAGTIGFRLGGDSPASVSVSVSNRHQIVVQAPGQSPRIAHLSDSASSQAAARPVTVRLAATETRLQVTAKRAMARTDAAVKIGLPLTPAQFATLGRTPVSVFATGTGLSIIPEIWDEAPAGEGRTMPAIGQRRWPASPGSRFAAHPAAGRVYQAAWMLGRQAPAQLLIVRNLLLADASVSGPRRLSDGDIEADTLWQGLAEAIQACDAEPEVRQAALAALAGLALDLVWPARDSSRGGAVLARLKPPAAGELRGRLEWQLDNQPSQSRNVKFRRRATPVDLWLAMPDTPFTGPHTLTARAELVWFGTPIVLERHLVVHPGIPRWHVLGPFMLTNAVLENAPFPPEDEPLDLNRMHAAPDGTQMGWRCVEPPPDAPLDADHLIHFAKGFRRQANYAAAYAATRIDSAHDADAVLALGAADGVQVWVNGACVLTDIRRREWTPGNVRVPIRLRRGANTVLVKSLHGDGLWFLSGRIEDAAQRPLKGISFPRLFEE